MEENSHECALPEEAAAFGPLNPKEGRGEMVRNLIKKFIRDEKGLETVEYAVMTALIVAAVVVAIGLLSGAVTDRFDSVEGVISGIT